MSSPFGDQFAAAARESLQIAVRQAAALGALITTVDDHADPTLTVLLDRVKTALKARQLDSCAHARSNPAQPMLVRMWDSPLVLRCTACNAAQPVLDKVADNTCDVCGRYDPSGVWPSLSVKANVTVLMGRCDDCVPRSVRERGPR